MNKENVTTYPEFLKKMHKQEERKKGIELAKRHITGRRKVIELPIGKVIKVDFTQE